MRKFQETAIWKQQAVFVIIKTGGRNGSTARQQAGGSSMEGRSSMEGMTRERMEAYRSMRDEIPELRHKLEGLNETDAVMGSSVIKDYRSGYPRLQAVAGVDWEKYFRLKKLYAGRAARLEKECEAVEDCIEGIQDSMTRRIFRMYYLEGKKQAKIARTLHIDQSVVSRKIKCFFEKT